MFQFLGLTFSKIFFAHGYVKNDNEYVRVENSNTGQLVFQVLWVDQAQKVPVSFL